VERVAAGELAVGDKVQAVDSASGNLTWSDVYHLREMEEVGLAGAKVVQVQGTPVDGTTPVLRLTAEHLVYVVKPSELRKHVPARVVEALRETSEGVACPEHGEWACPTVSHAGHVPAALLRQGDVILGVTEQGKQFLSRVKRVAAVNIRAERGEGLVTIHTIAGPVVASNMVASSYECNANHGYWDAVDLRVAYQVAPWLARASWFREAVTWADKVVYSDSPALARILGPALGQVELTDPLMTEKPARSPLLDAYFNRGLLPEAPLPEPFCPDGTKGRSVLE